jgi:DNA repair exonuclease SbcCD ATPase subunit
MDAGLRRTSFCRGVGMSFKIGSGDLIVSGDINSWEPDPEEAKMCHLKNKSHQEKIEDVERPIRFWKRKVGELTKKLSRYRGATKNCEQAIQARRDLDEAQERFEHYLDQLAQLQKPKKDTEEDGEGKDGAVGNKNRKARIFQKSLPVNRRKRCAA